MLMTNSTRRGGADIQMTILLSTINYIQVTGKFIKGFNKTFRNHF